MNDFPFEEKGNGNVRYRTFYESVDSSELVWHRDREDRVVNVIGETDWLFQIENELPRKMSDSFLIPKNTYHRIIKGTGELNVRIQII